MNSEQLEFLTVKEAAGVMKTTAKSLYAYLCKSGVKVGNNRKAIPKGIYIKIGRKVLFIKPKLIDWLLGGAEMEEIKG